MNIKHFSISCLLVFKSISVFSQNLVINPGFEEIDSLKRSPNAYESSFDFYGVLGWYNPNFATPDYYFTTSGRYEQDLTTHDLVQQPHSGNSFAGFIEYWNTAYREYIGGELVYPLESGKKYKFSFFMSRGARSTIRDQEIGVFFSVDKKFQKTNAVMNHYSPQLIIDTRNSNIYFNNWEEISGYYVATGGEKYFVVGDFRSSQSKVNLTTDTIPHTGSIPMGKTSLCAYYFIDDISLTIAKKNDTLEIASGTKLIFSSIHFSLNDSTITSDSYPLLDQIVAALKSQPKLKVEIDGHTDNTGTIEKNQKLSEARARAVANYFISKGIVPKRIKTKGYGSSKPISTDQNKNRRVEFIFY